MKANVKYKQYDIDNRDCTFYFELTSEVTDNYSSKGLLVYSKIMKVNIYDTISVFQYKNEAFPTGVKITPVFRTGGAVSSDISRAVFAPILLDTEVSTFTDVPYNTPKFNLVDIDSLTDEIARYHPVTLGFLIKGDITTESKVTFKILVERMRDAPNTIVLEK